MKEEDLIKKLEGIERHTIEPRSHRIHLREALLHSEYYKAKKGPGFLGFAKTKMTVLMIANRPVWRKALVRALVIAMIAGLCSIFLLGQDSSEQPLSWETVSPKACASINEVTSFHFDEDLARTVWYEGEKVYESTYKEEGDFLAPDQFRWVVKDSQETKEGLIKEGLIIGDIVYLWDSQTGEWEICQSKQDPNGNVIPFVPFGSYIQIQPVSISERLKELDDIEQLPDEVIDDINCLHYRGKLDQLKDKRERIEEQISRFPVAKEQLEEILEDMEENTPDVTIEIWVGEYDYMIRQLRIIRSQEQTVDPMDEIYKNNLVPADAIITNTVTQTIRFSGYNEPVVIEAPI